MDDKRAIAGVFPEQLIEAGFVPDIEIVVGIIPVLLFQTPAVPGYAPVWSEKRAAHVIVDADDIETFGAEKIDGF